MDNYSLTSCEKEVFAGLLSSGGSSMDILLEALKLEFEENSINIDQIANKIINDQ